MRFGLLMIPALALFSGYLMTAGQVVARRVLPVALLAVILVVSAMNWMGGKSLVLREALHGYGGDTRQTDQVGAKWLSTHYHGGNILYTYVNDSSLMFYLLTEYGFPDRAFITDANGAQFTRALADPQRWVTWIVLNNGLGSTRTRSGALSTGKAPGGAISSSARLFSASFRRGLTAVRP